MFFKNNISAIAVQRAFPGNVDLAGPFPRLHTTGDDSLYKLSYKVKL